MKNEIQGVVERYFKGYTEAESELMERAFHEETRLYSRSEDGGLYKTEMSDWLANIRDRKARQDIRTGSLRIENIDQAGNAAVAKVIITFPTLTFTDYLSLIKIDETWKIVGKIYSVQ